MQIVRDSAVNRLIITGGGGSASGADGSVQFAEGGVFASDPDNFFYDNTNKRLGLNTNTPEGALHVKEGSYTAQPNPTGTVGLAEIAGASWTNDGNSFDIRVYTYKIVEGVPIYSSSYVTIGYADDGLSDHTYNLEITMTDALPAGADGYRAFLAWTDSAATVQWSLDRYVEFTGLTATVTTVNPTLGSATSGTPVYKAIVENAETWLKNSNVRFMDSSGNTKAIWDKTNERFGVGTATPTQFTHFASTTTTLPPNPTGTATPTQDSGNYSDPYVATGITHTYRVYTYKVVGGQKILSANFISGTFTDNNDASNYSVLLTMSAAVPSGADGYFVIKLSLNYVITLYWIGGTTIVDEANPTGDNTAQFSAAIGRTLIDTSNLEIVYGSQRQLFFDAADGSFDKLEVKTRGINVTGFRIDCINGQTANPLVIANSAGSTLFSVSPTGAGGFAAGISATTAAFSAALTGTTASFSSNVSVTGTLSVTSTASFVSTITARSSTFTSTNASSVGLTVNGSASQTANLQEWRATSGGTILANITSAGNLTLAAAAAELKFGTAGNTLTRNGSTGEISLICQNFSGAGWLFTNTSGNAATVVQKIQAHASQSGNLTQWLNSAGTVLTSVSSAGLIDTTQLVQSAAGFRVTAFGTYCGVSGGSRITFGNGSGVSTFGTNNTSHVVSLIEAPTGQTADIQQWRVNSVALAGITAAGKQYFDATNTAAGTTGAQTINKPSGTVNFAAAATSLVVTNSLVTTSSIVMCVVRTNDTTATIKNVVPASGSFTINLGAAATAETSVGFIVYN